MRIAFRKVYSSDFRNILPILSIYFLIFRIIICILNAENVQKLSKDSTMRKASYHIQIQSLHIYNCLENELNFFLK